MKPTYTETPDETDFPLIDRCVECNKVCDWQPRYETAMRSDDETQALVVNGRPFDYQIAHRVVKICADCAPNDNRLLREMIRRLYPVYAKQKGI